MNKYLILWIFFLVDIWNSLSDFAKRKNLIKIKKQEFIPSSRWLCLICLTKDGPIVYDTNALKQLNSNTKCGTKYKVLTFRAISMICKLKLNRKKVKTTESTHDKLTINQNGVNHVNLKLIPPQANVGKYMQHMYRWELLMETHWKTKTKWYSWCSK